MPFLHTAESLRCLTAAAAVHERPPHHVHPLSLSAGCDPLQNKTNASAHYDSSLPLAAAILALMLHGLCPPSGWICITTLLAARPATAAAPRKRSSQGRPRVTAGVILEQNDETGHSPLAATTKSTHDTRERAVRRRNAHGPAIFAT